MPRPGMLPADGRLAFAWARGMIGMPGNLLHVTHRVTEAVPVRPRLPVMPSCTA
ncbi:hypothetical protein [Komagataeibacter europaeus]|uniref:hypothetical protein n=1 Tax=Komagataeibacter europaeus TaxID=33995 RepID=UPI000301A0D8|nr:hypothetical protein [Komagataeibacter europaeus]